MKKIFNKKNGFTLIELLAVVILLAVVALFSAPIMIDIIETAQKEGFRDTAYGLVSTAEGYLAEQIIKNKGSFEPKTFVFPEASGLIFSGERPIGGEIVLQKDGKTSVAIYNRKWCAIKDFDTKVVDVEKIVDGICEDSQTEPGSMCGPGSMRLNLFYPNNAINKMWRLSKAGEIRSSTNLSWQEYIGPICVKLKDVEKIWIKYDVEENGVVETIITPPKNELLIDISHKIDNKNAIVNIEFDKDAYDKMYRIGNSRWIDYTDNFIVTENTTIYAKAKKTVQVYDLYNNLIEEVEITGYDIYAINDFKEEFIVDEQLFPPIIEKIDNGTLAPKVKITYPNNDDIKKIYKINSGEELDYTEIIDNLKWGTEIKAYYYKDDKMSPIVSLVLDKNPEKLDVDIVAIPEASLDSNVKKVEVTIIYDDRSISNQYKINNDEFKQYTDTFLVLKDSIITATAVNEDGNGIATKNIIFKAPSVLNAPIINGLISSDKTKSTITITYDSNSISNKYSVDGGELQDYINSFDIYKNGTVIYAESTDIDGNIKTSTYTVTGIDKEGPIYELKAPTINGVISSDKTKSTITITYDSNSISNKYSVDGGELQDYINSFDIYKNGTVIYAESTDIGGNIKTSTYTVTGIDKEGPIYELKAPRITSYLSDDKSKATINIAYDNKENITKKYRIDDGNLQDYTASFDIYKNGTVIYAESTDIDGNIKTSTHTVTDILKKLNVEILVNPDTTSIIEKATITINYDSDATIKQYQINGGPILDYMEPFEIESKSTIKAIAKAVEAYGEAYKMVDNFAKGLTQPIISYSKTTIDYKDKALVNIKYDDNAVIKKYSINDGPLKDYTNNFEILENGTIIYAYSMDDKGNVANSSLVINDLKKISFIEYENYFIVKLQYPPNSINHEYKYGNNNWKAYNINGFALIKEKYKDKVIAGQPLKLEDENGNIFDYSGDYYIVNINDFNVLQDDIYMRWNYDNSSDPTIINKQKQQSIVFPQDTQTDKVYIMVVPESDSEYAEYSINDGPYIKYTKPIEIEENNTTVKVRSKMPDGTYTDIIEYAVNNIVDMVYEDGSGANKPELYNKMIPVTYDGTNWVYADINNKWYDYNAKQWANAVVLNSGVTKNVGNTISAAEIAMMYVWIPRYKYTIFNGNNGSVSPQQINIVFETGTAKTGTVTNGTGTYTHPAFTFGNKELTGIWVGKFENSAPNVETNGVQKVVIKPNVRSWRSTTVSNFYQSILNIKTDYSMSGIDSHMMKNMEWGAVAYLKQSKHGLGTTDIGINNNQNYTTGCGASAGSSSTTGCNAYNTTTGMLASTTGNIYGIYDMSGGAHEYVMGNMVNSSNQFYSSSAGFVVTPPTKYYDSYTYDGSSNITHSRGRLGDATKETLQNYGNYTGGWYGDYAFFPYASNSWFLRGGLYSNGAYAGVFNFNFNNGAAYSSHASRAVVVSIDDN